MPEAELKCQKNLHRAVQVQLDSSSIWTTTLSIRGSCTWKSTGPLRRHVTRVSVIPRSSGVSINDTHLKSAPINQAYKAAGRSILALSPSRALSLSFFPISPSGKRRVSTHHFYTTLWANNLFTATGVSGLHVGQV